MKSADVRKTFLSYFEQRGHTIVPSAPLIPAGDPTLLFVNAGMVPFKDVFLGKEKRSYKRAASCQKCLRVSGKHNDLEEVGPSSHHHTFFEMLGKFSFGDYFKDEALAYTWEFLTKVVDIPAAKLHPTVFEEDDESARIWAKLTGRSGSSIVRLGAEDNFWAMGDTGPCGPNSEVMYDRTGRCLKDGSDCPLTCDCDRWWELCNDVFMTYDRAPDGTLTPLAQPGVDFGMGFERLCAVLQGASSSYETDLFVPLIERLRALTGDAEITDERRPAYRAVADHARAVTFLLADGLVPSNDGRGYVLRRILRRASYQARLLGLDKPFLSQICDVVIEIMGHAYLEVLERARQINAMVADEEQRFLEVLPKGSAILDGMMTYRGHNFGGTRLVADFALERSPGADNAGLVLEQYGFAPSALDDPGMRLGEELAAEAFERRFRKALELLDEGNVDASKSVLQEFRRLEQQLSPEEAFRLYDTYGFPIDLTRKVLEARGWAVDEQGFERALEEQRERGREAQVEGKERDNELLSATRDLPATRFLGYDAMAAEANVLLVSAADDGVEVVLDQSPFYAEGGGQVGDSGRIAGANGEIEIASVRRLGGIIIHSGRVVRGAIAEGDSVHAEVDESARRATMRNHTATHLLHKALRVVLGPQAKQAGSLVAPDRLRFDFVHGKPLTDDELREVERIVREQIVLDRHVRTDVMPTQEALGSGADAMFDEKYGEEARVVTVANGDVFSRELCGGTHCRDTGEIGAFFIVEQRSVGAGVRRVEAVTGFGAFEYADARRRVVDELSHTYNVPPQELPERLRSLQERAREAPKAAAAALPDPSDVLSRAEQRNGSYVIVDWLEGADANTLRQFGDALRSKAKSAAIVLGSVTEDKLNVVVMLTNDLVEKGMNAGKLAQQIGKALGGGGGGRPDVATAGGTPVSKDAALAKARELLGVGG